MQAEVCTEVAINYINMNNDIYSSEKIFNFISVENVNLTNITF